MVGCHHRFNGHEFEKDPGDDEAQGSLACCSPWSHKESDTSEGLNDDDKLIRSQHHQPFGSNHLGSTCL